MSELLRFRAKMGNLTVGKLSALNISDAERIVQETYGPTATVELVEGCEQQDINEMLDDFEEREMPLAIIPDYEVKTFWSELKSTPEFDSVVNHWLRKNRGIRIISSNRIHKPPTDKTLGYGTIYHTIVFYRLIQFPTRRTIQEVMGGQTDLPVDKLKEEKEFFSRLTGSLTSNDALFRYAENEKIEWTPKGNATGDRVLCIQAIRRAKGWLK